MIRRFGFLLLISTSWAQAACFDDAKLDALINDSLNKPVLLYVWSPRMEYSVHNSELALEATRKHGLQFLPLHDERIAAAEVLASLAASSKPTQQALQGSMPLCSDRLVAMEAKRHFPSSFIIRDGAIDIQTIVGAMPAEGWNKRLINPNQCIPQNEFVVMPAALAGTQTDAFGKTTVALGSYERVSPDGRFILRSYSGARLGDVSVVELSHAMSDRSTRVVNVSRTPLANEAFPVQGTWRYLVSTSGEHYQFKDVLERQARAKPLFKSGMTGFYAAAAELTTPSKDSATIRSFSWPNANETSEQQGVGMLATRTITVNTQTNQVTHDSGHTRICANRKAEDGELYALPMISVSGEEFAALPQQPKDGKQHMRVYGFGASGKDCELRGRFDFNSGKAIFGFAEERSRTTKRMAGANLAYEYKQQAWWYAQAFGQRFNLAPHAGSADSHHPNIKDVEAHAFPGITRDGRVIYGATWKHCEKNNCKQEAGYVIADPWQSNAFLEFASRARFHKDFAPRCVTYGDVARERADFAAFHQLKD